MVVDREAHATSCFGHIAVAECRFMLAQFASCGRATSGLCFVHSCVVALHRPLSEWRLPEDLGLPGYDLRECRLLCLEAAIATCCFCEPVCQMPRRSHFLRAEAHELQTNAAAGTEERPGFQAPQVAGSVHVSQRPLLSSFPPFFWCHHPPTICPKGGPEAQKP